jgi:naphthalene 1,2-dioxygenase ferredoxin reductase component
MSEKVIPEIAVVGIDIGKTSFHVRTALAACSPHSIHLYFGVCTERDVYDEHALLALAAEHPNLRVEIVLSGADDPGDRRRGFVHEAIAEDLPTLTDTKLYIAGPPPMVEAVAATARSRGARSSDIHADAFTSAAPEPRSKGVVSRFRGLLRSRLG